MTTIDFRSFMIKKKPDWQLLSVVTQSLIFLSLCLFFVSTGQARPTNYSDSDVKTIRHDSRPTILEYAIMSKLAYEDVFYNQRIKIRKPIELPGWIIDNAYRKDNGYGALVFRNDETHQLVIAHRGTVPSQLGNLWEDFRGIALNQASPYKRNIFEVVQAELRSLPAVGGIPYRLSFTGHSLGAFLAELSVFYCHNGNPLYYPGASAVTFESPGSYESMEAFQTNLLPKVELAELDIVSYVGTPNVINTLNRHVGTLYQVEHNLGDGINKSWDPTSYTLNCHAIDRIVTFLEKALPTREATKSEGIYHISDWPLGGLKLGSQKDLYFAQANWDKSCNCYRLDDRIAQGLELFDLVYQAHYQIQQDYDPNYTLALKHFDKEMREFLQEFYNWTTVALDSGSDRASLSHDLISRDIPVEVANYLLGFQLASLKDRQWMVVLNNQLKFNIYQFRYELTKFLSVRTNYRLVIDFIRDLKRRCDVHHLTNFPAPVNNYQERREKSDQIVAAIAHGNREIYLTGMRGTGKTQLALSYAKEHQHHYQHVRFFNAESPQELQGNFEDLARKLSLEDFKTCAYGDERCLKDVVNICLREVKGKFLWIFDNMQSYADIKKYLPREDNLKITVIITTNNRSYFCKEERCVNLDEGMTDNEAIKLLNSTIHQESKAKYSRNPTDTCTLDRLKILAVDRCKGFPLAISEAGENISIIESCAEKYHDQIIKDIASPEEAVYEQLNYLNDRELAIISFCSFMVRPVSKQLLISYLVNNFNNLYMLDVMKLIIRHPFITIINAIEEDFIQDEVQLSHPLFRIETQRLLVEKGIKEQELQRITKFFDDNFSGEFWNKKQWDKEERSAWLRAAGDIVTFMADSMENRQFEIYQLALWYKLAKSYITSDPKKAVSLFEKLHTTIATRKQSWSSYLGFDDTTREYYNGSLNHAKTMQLLAVAYYQAWYENTTETSYLEQAKHSAKEAYQLFKKQLGVEAPNTLNTYLVIEHIGKIIDNDKDYQPSENDLVQFVGSEPTIIAAIERLGLVLATEDFNQVQNDLANNVKNELLISLLPSLEGSRKEL